MRCGPYGADCTARRCASGAPRTARRQGEKMTRNVFRPGPRLVLLAVAGLLLWGLAGGVTSAFGADASSPSASPAAAAVLHVGWTAEPDNLNPHGRVRDVGARDLPPQLRLPGRVQGERPAADAGAGDQLGALTRRQGVDVQAARRRQVAGRRALHRRRRRVHLPDHHRGRGQQLRRLHGAHRDGQGARPADGRVHLQQAQDEHARDADPHPARAHLEQADRPRRSPTPSRTTRR